MTSYNTTAIVDSQGVCSWRGGQVVRLNHEEQHVRPFVTRMANEATHYRRSVLRVMCLAAGAVSATIAGQADTLTVINSAGDVRVVTTADNQLTISGRTPNGAAGRADLDITRDGEETRIDVLPRESELDLTVTIPLGNALEVTTTTGDISVEGMVHLARLHTDTGAIRLKAPLEGIRVSLDAAAPPINFVSPDRQLFRTSDMPLAEGQPWRLRDRLEEDAIRYGDYRITAESPSTIELTEFEPPEGWPLRFPSDALGELHRTLEPALANGNDPRSDELAPTSPDAGLVFTARVRMVNLSVAVSDAEGSPVSGLGAADFRVVEEGMEQRLSQVQGGDAAFNLAIVLDMSGSSIAYREPIQAAARRFVEMARPEDRVAIYALTFGMFQVVSPLSSDREALLAAVDNLPGVAGASPLFDIVTLAYAQELRQLPGERNAMIVISDGLDNRITGGSGPSTVKFSQLRRMAEEMSAIIYPVLLVSTNRQGQRGNAMSMILLGESRRRAARRMQTLAAASGGRLFPAQSIEDLEPVFPLIEAELRSVYSLGYYPENQDLDGSWRTVDITVRRPGLTVRTRPGYYAK